MKTKTQLNRVEQWRRNLTLEERKMRYLESIPKQVHDSMAFEGEPVSLRMLKEYLKSLRNTPQPHGS